MVKREKLEILDESEGGQPRRKRARLSHVVNGIPQAQAAAVAVSASALSPAAPYDDAAAARESMPPPPPPPPRMNGVSHPRSRSPRRFHASQASQLAIKGERDVDAHSQSSLARVHEEKDNGVDEDEDADDEKSMQVVLRRSEGTGRFAEAGILKRLQFINWMCFKSFEIVLGPNVNVIHGQNGSGKSAILQGLCVALGARAKDTMRAKSIKSLIRDGAGYAELTVEILNGGTDAIEGFPRVIKVQRIISRSSGQSRYKIWGMDNRPRSMNKSELESILSHFSIQVTNPCVMLNQDAAREFLQRADKNGLYDLFAKSAMVTETNANLVKLNESIETITDIINHARLELPALESKVRADKNEVDRAQSLTVLGAEVEKLRLAVAWDFVRNEEAILEEKRNTRDGLNAKTERLDDIIKTAKATVDEMDGQRDSVNSTMNELKKALRDAKLEFTECQKTVAAKTRRIRELQNQVTACDRQINQYQSQKANAEARRKEIQEQDRSELKEEHERLDSLIKREYGALNERKEERKAAKQEEDALPSADDSQCAVKDARADLKRKQDDLKAVGSRLHTMKRQQKSSVSVFGAHYVEIERKLDQNARQFSRRPIGPLGRYVKVKDDRWTKAIETRLGGHMYAYLVNSFEDRVRFERLIKPLCRQRRYPFPTLLVKNYANAGDYNIPQNGHNKPRLYDMIEFTPDQSEGRNFDPTNADWAMKVLIDMAKLDRSYLIDDIRDARDWLKDTLTQHYQHTQRHLGLNVYCRDGATVSGKYNAIQSLPGDFRNNSGVLGVDVQQIIAREEEEKTRLEHEVQVIHNTVNSMELELRNHTRNARKARQKVLSIDGKMAHHEAKIADLQSEQQALSEQSTEDLVEETNLEIATLETEIANVAEIRSQRIGTISERERELHQQNRELAEKRDALKKVLAEHEVKVKEKEEFVPKFIKANRTFEGGKEKKRRLVGQLNDAKKQYDVQEAKVEHHTASAKRIGPRTESGGISSDELHRLYTSKRESYRRQKGHHEDMNINDMKERYQESLRAYNAKRRLIRRHELSMENLQYYLQMRLLDKTRLQRTLGKQVQLVFGNNLQKQGHRGELAIDHQSRTLSLDVFTANSQLDAETEAELDELMSQREEAKRKRSRGGKRRAGGGVSERRDTKGLSGGERSFATLAFVVSLGEVINAPFRALDEYDIYMDAINRRISTRLLLGLGIKSPHRQFFFLTPQDVSDIESTDRCKVHVLVPAERRDAAQ